MIDDFIFIFRYFAAVHLNDILALESYLFATMILLFLNFQCEILRR